MAQILVTFVCSECKRRNYTTTRNKKNSSLSFKKYCKFCRKHTIHKGK